MQNPTCGVAEGIGYSYDYESLTVYWDEDFETNMYKQIAEVNAAKQAAQSIEATASTDIDKIVAINNYLCEIGTYDTASAEADESVITEAVINAHTPYGILINHLGVCESYAESFTLIARYLGFDCLNEAGTIYGGPHEWARVKIGNNWYVVDPTNNDLELADNALLAISDEQKSGTLVAYGGYAYFGSYPATDDSLEYYTRNGSTATSTEDAYNKLVEQLNTSSTAAIRLPNGSTEDQAIEIIQRIIKQANIQLTNAMYICDVVAVTR
jgi:transglutaminase-like putative cysteine protease